jgi:ABC-type branched-subunit amino acid transport system substrate-binding protein/serine/threonine protein kinase
LGVAFLGCDRRTPGMKRCVIKQLMLNPSFNTTQLEIATKLFHREAEVLEKLGEHPRIPRLFAFLELTASAAPPYTQQKFFYLVQEYIEGQNLQQELAAKGRFSETEVIEVLREIAKILEFIHIQGTIHRDVKPSNIMRDLQGKIHLIDFGAVKQVVAETARSSGRLSDRNLTCVFTPEYAPWEQRQGQGIYPSSDLYSLAVTCLNLLTGKQPQELLDRSNNWQWRTPDLDVSDALADILDKMLQALPPERFETARDVLEALDDTLGIPVLSIAPKSRPTPSVPAAKTVFLGTGEPEPLQRENNGAHIEPQPLLVDSYPVQSEPQPLQFETYPSSDDNSFSLQLIETTRQPTKPKQPWLVGGLVVAGIVGVGAIVSQLLLPSLFGSKINDAIASRSSTGDRILLAVEGDSDTSKFRELKRAGIVAMANRNYEEAAKQFQAALTENPNSPETRIYLNNALIGDRQSYTIATSAPIARSLDRAAEMLRGFAQAQTEINQVGAANEAKIKLRIIDDSDDPKAIESIAQAVVDRSDILGVVGHNRNDVAMKASTVYNTNKLSFIAPISTANELTSTTKPYVFRTNVSADKIAQKLVDRIVDTERKRKVAIFYVPTVIYNNEFKTQFARKLVEKGGEVVDTYRFSTVASTASPAPSPAPTFDAQTSLAKAKAMGAQAILVLPVGRSSREALSLLKLRATKYPELSVLGDTALYNLNTLRAGGASEGLVMGVPWQESESTPQFSAGAKQLWKTQVNWATATSYNAVKAMATAIKNQESPSRTGVMDSLTKNEFTGASGRLQFTKGEPTDRYVLVKVAPTPPNYKYSSSTGYDFVSIESF